MKGMENPTQILVVDDDREIRMLLAEYLDSNGFRTFTAGNGVEMRKQLESVRIDLVVLDLTLPGEDGLTLCRTLRANSTLPVIMLTTTDDPREIERCYQLGCNIYVTKPVEYESFIEAVRRLGFFLQVVKLPPARSGSA